MSIRDNDNIESLGDYIKFRRKMKGLRLKDVADKTGTSVGYLSRLENKKRLEPSYDVLKRLSNTLEVSIMDLLQVSLGTKNTNLDNLRDTILEGKYTIDGVEISHETKILLWNVIEYILDDNRRTEEIFKIYISELISRIKLLSKSL